MEHTRRAMYDSSVGHVGMLHLHNIHVRRATYEPRVVNSWPGWHTVCHVQLIEIIGLLAPALGFMTRASCMCAACAHTRHCAPQCPTFTTELSGMWDNVRGGMRFSQDGAPRPTSDSEGGSFELRRVCVCVCRPKWDSRRRRAQGTTAGRDVGKRAQNGGL